MQEERKVLSMWSGATRVAATSSTLYSESTVMFIDEVGVDGGCEWKKQKRNVECYKCKEGRICNL